MAQGTLVSVGQVFDLANSSYPDTLYCGIEVGKNPFGKKHRLYFFDRNPGENPPVEKARFSTVIHSIKIGNDSLNFTQKGNRCGVRVRHPNGIQPKTGWYVYVSEEHANEALRLQREKEQSDRMTKVITKKPKHW